MARTKKTTTTKSSKPTKKSNSTNKNSSVTSKDVEAARTAVEKQFNTKKMKEAIMPDVSQAKVVKNSFAPMPTYNDLLYPNNDPGPVPMDELRSAIKPNRTELQEASIIGTTRPIFYPFKAFMGEGMVYINLSQIRRIAKYTTSTKEVCQVCDGQTTQLVEATLIEVMAIIGANV